MMSIGLVIIILMISDLTFLLFFFWKRILNSIAHISSFLKESVRKELLFSSLVVVVFYYYFPTIRATI